MLYDTAGFTTAATNLLSPGSFEDPSLPTGWVATGAAATNGPITLAGAPDASRVWSLPYGGAGSYTEAYSPIVPALANSTYTVSGFVKGTSTGLVTPYFYLYDQFQQCHHLLVLLTVRQIQ